LSEPRRKYQFMQGNTERRRQGLREKIPDIQKTLDVVQLLKMRGVRLPRLARTREADLLMQPDAEPLETTFELSDTLYAKALVPPPNEVYLWLGVGLALPIFGTIGF
jgi:Prefoldin subunit